LSPGRAKDFSNIDSGAGLMYIIGDLAGVAVSLVNEGGKDAS
jgi:hypothetical protein